MLVVVACLLELVVVAVAAWLVVARHYRRAKQLEIEAERLRAGSEKEAEARKKEAQLEAKEESLRLRAEAEQQHRERKQQLEKLEARLLSKEENLDRRIEGLEKKERAIGEQEQQVAEIRSQMTQLLAEQKAELERISGISADAARQLLMKQVEEESRQDAARLIQQVEEEARDEADRRARHIVSLSIQRVAVDHTSESTVSVVPLPNDDMKGRIIGREGRNIRAFENLTGVDLIIDDTPEAVVISGFDPIRREVARIALGTLVGDGRIHPGRIEETINRAKAEVEEKIREAGERAMVETSITNLHPELTKLLGKLRFRTSFGQNVLNHSLEVSHLCGTIAFELGADAAVAKRAGLLHDLGKAVDFEVDGGHASIGARLARQYRETREVVHAISAHHEEEPFETVEAVLVHAADAISASRPGARREALESYLKRLQKLEEIADSFSGVEKSYAIQAGREVRIIVKPDQLDDLAAARLAKELVKKIQDGLEYPGQIRVTVIRETRAVEYAK